MARNNLKQWTKFIEQALNIYLNRKHRTIGMTPLEAEQEKKSNNTSENILQNIPVDLLFSDLSKNRLELAIMTSHRHIGKFFMVFPLQKSFRLINF